MTYGAAPSDIAGEFDKAMARCGLTVAPDRRSGALSTWQELMHMSALLRQPRDEKSEPSNVFRHDIVLRRS